MKTLLAAALLAALPAPAAPVPKPKAANLLANGSFEDGPDVEVFKPLDKGSDAITGWVVTRGQIDLVQRAGDQWGAAHGRRLIDLHGSPGLGGVEQTIPTRPGRKYQVTFRMSGNPGVPHPDGRVRLAVRAAGVSKEFELDMAGRSYEDLKWTEKSWAFTATADKTTLELHTAMPPTANAFGGPLLDDVKVAEAD